MNGEVMVWEKKLGASDMVSANKKVERLKKQKQARDDRQKVIEGLLNVQTEWLRLIDALAKILPNNVWLTNLDGQKRGEEMRITLQGIALSDNEIFKLDERLRLLDWFGEIQLDNVNLARSTPVGYRALSFRFVIKGEPDFK